MMRSQSFRQFDLIMLLSCFALIVYGLVILYSGSYEEVRRGLAPLQNPVIRQLGFTVVGATAMIVASQVDYRAFGRFAIVVYLASLMVLASVLVLGDDVNGSRRWLTLGNIQLQPSEVMKLTTALMLAQYFSKNRERLHSAWAMIVSLGIVVPPLLLVLVQPDLGSAIVFGLLWLGMALMAGVNTRHIAVLMTIVFLALPFVMLFAMTEYQKDRLTLFFHPESDPLGGGFNIIQAEIGIGSGGLFGKGLTQGLQTQNSLVSSQTTDYIFSIVGEELGMVGALLLFALFMLFLFRTLKTATVAQDRFGELIAVGVAIMVLAQVFINVGVNIRLLPVTGIPLPFFSQGGSSLVTLLTAVGILQSIRIHQKRFKFSSGGSG